MGGLVSTKMLVLLAVALIVLGPEKLPDMARTAGRLLSEFRRVSAGLQEEVTSAFGTDVTSSITEFRTAAGSWRTTATSWVASTASPPMVASDGTPPAATAPGPINRPVAVAAPSAPFVVPDDELGYPPGDPALN